MTTDLLLSSTDIFGKAITLAMKFPTLTSLSGFAEANEVLDGLELPDGRIIFAVQEHGTIAGNSCNFWTVKIDPRTGKAVDKPQQLTHWPGFCMSHISVTNDGKKLTFMHGLFEQRSMQLIYRQEERGLSTNDISLSVKAEIIQ